VGSFFYLGTTTIIGHAQASGHSKEAELFAIQTISFGVLHAILLTVFGWLTTPAIFLTAPFLP